MLETKALPRTNAIKKASERIFKIILIEIAAFSRNVGEYDHLMPFYLDCYKLMSVLPPLVVPEAGPEDRMFQRQIAALSNLRQIPLCATLGYECYNLVREYGSLNYIWYYRSYYLPLLTNSIAGQTTLHSDNMIGIINILMDCHENV